MMKQLKQRVVQSTQSAPLLVLALLVTSLLAACSKDAVEEGDYSQLRSGLFAEQSGSTTIYYVPAASNGSEVEVTWNRNADLTYERLVQMMGGSYDVKYNGTGVKGITDYTGDVVIPQTAGGRTVSAIGKWAFTGNLGLTSLTIPEGIRRIEDESVTFCTALTKADLPSSVNYIGDAAFAYTALTDVTIPAAVTYLGRFAFAYNNALTTVTFAAGSQLETIGACAFMPFSGGSKLTSITLPASVKVIGPQTFRYCKKLQTIDLSQTQITEVPDFAFNNCVNGTEIKLPATVVKIGAQAISNNKNVKALHLASTTPPSLDALTTFHSKTTIYVPAAAVDSYKADEQWSKYASQIKAEP